MSKMSKDPDYAIKIEKAIADKYGIDTIQHPAKNWNPEKEEIYLEQIKLLNQKLDKISEKLEKVEVQGVLISKKLLNKDSNRVCPICHIYSFDSKDDIHMTKHDCCYKCYITWIDGREKRWAAGWLPEQGEKK